MNNNKDTDQRIDAILKKRGFTTSGDDMPDRIASAARSMPQKNNETIIEWIQELFTPLAIPRSYCAILFVLLIGFIAGFLVPVIESEIDVKHEETIYMQEFLYASGREL